MPLLGMCMKVLWYPNSPFARSIGSPWFFVSVLVVPPLVAFDRLGSEPGSVVSKIAPVLEVMPPDIVLPVVVSEGVGGLAIVPSSYSSWISSVVNAWS